MKDEKWESIKKIVIAFFISHNYVTLISYWILPQNYLANYKLKLLKKLKSHY